MYKIYCFCKFMWSRAINSFNIVHNSAHVLQNAKPEGETTMLKCRNYDGEKSKQR